MTRALATHRIEARRPEPGSQGPDLEARMTVAVLALQALVAVPAERQHEAGAHLAAAEHAIEELRVSGHQVTAERFRYQTALTSYQQMAHGLHSLDVEALDELGRRVRSNPGLVRGTAEARAEGRWEHKLMLVPVWFLALAAVALAWFKLRDLGDGFGRW